jgi:hypothetical protein
MHHRGFDFDERIGINQNYSDSLSSVFGSVAPRLKLCLDWLTACSNSAYNSGKGTLSNAEVRRVFWGTMTQSTKAK